MSLPALISLGFALAVFCLALAFFTPAITRLRLRFAHSLARLERGGTLGAQTTRSARVLREEAPEGLFGRLSQAPLLRGLALTGRQLMLVLPVCLGLAVLAWLLTGLPFLLVLPGALVLVVLLALWLSRRRVAKRAALIQDGMPEALDTIVRTLKVGLPITTAMRHVSEKLRGPLAGEFGKAVDRISFGQDTTSALYAMAHGTRNTDLHFLAASVSIQMQTGGNLAEVLDRLSQIARARQQLRRKVDAITAEARWSGRFLSAFPLFAIFVIWLVNNDYFDPLLESDFVTPVAVVVGILLVINVLFMRWLSRID